MFKIFNKTPKVTKDEEEFYKRKKKLEEKFCVSATFGSSSLEMPIDFEIDKEWTQLKDHTTGLVQFKCFSEEARELINGVERVTKSAQNWWKKGSTLKTHHHPDADEYIYLVHGVLLLILEKEGIKIEKTYIAELDQPIYIPKGMKHFTKALTDCSFVVKFVF